MYRVWLFFIASLLVFSFVTASAEEPPLVQLKSQYSGKCLTVKGGSVAHGATLIHKDCQLGGQNMVWEMRPQGSGYWIVNKHSGLCLGVAHQSKKDGEQVTQVSACGRPDTVWRVENVDPNPSQNPNPLAPPVDYEKTIVIRNDNSNKCLALVRGDEIKQYGCPPHRAKTTWQFVKANLDAPTAGRIPVKAGLSTPFYLDGRAYVFGSVCDFERDGSLSQSQQTDKAAFSWLIHEDPKMGFTPMMQEAKMSSSYSAVTSFTLNGYPYIFGLHKPPGYKVEDYSANIWRIGEGGKGLDLEVYKGKMSSSYSSVKSFQLKGKPYIFGLHKGKTDHEGRMWSVDDAGGGKATFNPVKYKRGAKTQISPYYKHIETFYIGGHPYIFGLHIGKEKDDHSANIWRIRDDPSEGFDLVRYGVKFPLTYDFILPFNIGDSSYLLAAASHPPEKKETLPDIPFPGKIGDVFQVIKLGSDLIDSINYLAEEGEGYVVIYKVEGNPMSPTIRRITPMFPISERYRTMTVFEQGGNTYLFGVHRESYANIWRIGQVVKKSEADPEIIMSLEYYGRNK